jgi:hypothetical protein
MAIWQDLADNQGFGASYQSVQRFVRKLQIAISPTAAGRALIMTASPLKPCHGCGLVREVYEGLGPSAKQAVSSRRNAPRQEVTFPVFRDLEFFAIVSNTEFLVPGMIMRTTLDNLSTGDLDFRNSEIISDVLGRENREKGVPADYRIDHLGEVNKLYLRAEKTYRALP